MRAHYYFLTPQSAPIIQGGTVIKGVQYFLLKFLRSGISNLKGYLVSKMHSFNALISVLNKFLSRYDAFDYKLAL